MQTIIRLINNKSILQCNGIEKTKHKNEIFSFFDKMSEIKEFKCALLCQHQDFLHKNENTIIKHCFMDQIIEEIRSFDTYNGIDIFVDNYNYFIILTYGHNYSFKGKDDVVRVAIKILPFNQAGDFLDISQFVFFNGNVKISKQQFKDFSLYR